MSLMMGSCIASGDTNTGISSPGLARRFLTGVNGRVLLFFLINGSSAHWSLSRLRLSPISPPAFRVSAQLLCQSKHLDFRNDSEENLANIVILVGTICRTANLRHDRMAIKLTARRFSCQRMFADTRFASQEGLVSTTLGKAQPKRID